jgi:hypothetical protein
MAKKPPPQDPPALSNPESEGTGHAAGTEAASGGNGEPLFLLPPQGPGIPRRPFLTGAPANEQRFNVAMRVLNDPVARISASRVYSGQARNWSR